MSLAQSRVEPVKQVLIQALCAGCGGFLGAVARFGITLGMRKAWPTFPAGTMLVNLLGCVILGAVMGATLDSRQLSPETRAFLTVGLLGSFTTFATFSYEGFHLIRSGDRLNAILYVVGSVVLGLLLLLVGYELAQRACARS